MRRCAKSKRKISALPSAFRGFSVAMSPVDSKTTKRPSPLMLPAKDSKVELVICPLTVSTCAVECELKAKTKSPMEKRNCRSVTNVLQSCVWPHCSTQFSIGHPLSSKIQYFKD
jgi:hypothetical protein